MREHILWGVLYPTAHGPGVCDAYRFVRLAGENIAAFTTQEAAEMFARTNKALHCPRVLTIPDGPRYSRRVVVV